MLNKKSEMNCTKKRKEFFKKQTTNFLKTKETKQQQSAYIKLVLVLLIFW